MSCFAIWSSGLSQSARSQRIAKSRCFLLPSPLELRVLVVVMVVVVVVVFFAGRSSSNISYSRKSSSYGGNLPYSTLFRETVGSAEREIRWRISGQGSCPVPAGTDLRLLFYLSLHLGASARLADGLRKFKDVRGGETPSFHLCILLYQSSLRIQRNTFSNFQGTTPFTWSQY